MNAEARWRVLGAMDRVRQFHSSGETASMLRMRRREWMALGAELALVDEALLAADAAGILEAFV